MKNYWKMSTEELMEYCKQYQITEYHYGPTRKIYIDQLLAMENAKNMSWSRLSMIITLIATAINVSVLIYSLATK
jgi:hypothetical protein